MYCISIIFHICPTMKRVLCAFLHFFIMYYDSLISSVKGFFFQYIGTVHCDCKIFPTTSSCKLKCNKINDLKSH